MSIELQIKEIPSQYLLIYKLHNKDLFWIVLKSDNKIDLERHAARHFSDKDIYYIIKVKDKLSLVNLNKRLLHKDDLIALDMHCLI